MSDETALTREHRPGGGAGAGPDARYGTRVLAVEPFGTERIPAAERHGRPAHLFTLWLGANLTIADYALGFLPVGLGLGLWPTALALLAGNLLGGAALGMAAAMGPRTGQPQMVAGRLAFGRRGGYFFALLNWISTVGWFTVNTVLGAFGLRLLLPGLGFVAAAAVITLVQVLLAVFGHNLIHGYERLMSLVLGVLFAVATVIAATRGATLAAWHPVPHGPAVALVGVTLGAAFSYIASWAPYAADYSRYLPEATRSGPCFGWTFLGAGLASFWLEVLGALVAVLAGSAAGDPVAALQHVMGGFGGAAVLAVVLGATAANALNLYSNALSAGALDLRARRWALALAAGALGLALSLYGAGRFNAFYSNFLLLLDYWITPWMGILFVDFFLLRRGGRLGLASEPGVRRQGAVAYVVGVAVSVPFMAGALYTGPIGRAAGGADFSYFVALVVAAGLYWALAAGRAASPRT